MPGYNPDHVFDPKLLQQELTVRNWRPGDRFWPGAQQIFQEDQDVVAGAKTRCQRA